MTVSVQVRIIDGTLVESTATFTNPAGVATDPATVIVQWQKPDGTIDEFTYGIDAQVVKTGTGAYNCQELTDDHGGWLVQWDGVGLAVGSIAFKVQQRAIA